MNFFLRDLLSIQASVPSSGRKPHWTQCDFWVNAQFIVWLPWHFEHLFKEKFPKWFFIPLVLQLSIYTKCLNLQILLDLRIYSATSQQCIISRMAILQDMEECVNKRFRQIGWWTCILKSEKLYVITKALTLCAFRI